MNHQEKKKKQDEHKEWKQDLKTRQLKWDNMSNEQKKQHYNKILSEYPPCSERDGYEEEVGKLCQ